MADNENSQSTQQQQEVKTFKYADPISKKEFDLPLEFQETIGHINKVVRDDINAKHRKELEALRGQMTTDSEAKRQLEERLQQIEDEKLSAEERVKAKYDRELKTWETKFNEQSQATQKFQTMFQNTKIDNDLMSALGAYELNNPVQAMRLLKMDGQAKVDENGEKTVLYFADENGELQELSPKDAVARYFALPENMHHLKKNINAGSGSAQHGQVDTSGNLVFSKDKIATDPKARSEYNAKIREGHKVTLK